MQKSQVAFTPFHKLLIALPGLLKGAGSAVIYLSTDAAESETDLLQSLITVNGKTVPLVKRPSHTSVEKWDALLSRHGIEDDSQVSYVSSVSFFFYLHPLG